MPQPIRKPCAIELTGLWKRPLHAERLGQIVATSGRLEALLGWLLAFFSGGSAEITIPMFHAVTSTDAQRAMLEAAAERVLKGAELIGFNELMEDFRPRYRERSRLVHNIWGHSDAHPDAAIWCQASDAAAFMAQAASAKAWEELPDFSLTSLSLKCCTYSVKDMADIAGRLEEYRARTNNFLSDLMRNHPALVALANAAQDAAQRMAESQPQPPTLDQTAPK